MMMAVKETKEKEGQSTKNGVEVSGGGSTTGAGEKERERREKGGGGGREKAEDEIL